MNDTAAKLGQATAQIKALRDAADKDAETRAQQAQVELEKIRHERQVLSDSEKVARAENVALKKLHVDTLKRLDEAAAQTRAFRAKARDADAAHETAQTKSVQAEAKRKLSEVQDMMRRAILSRQDAERVKAAAVAAKAKAQSEAEQAKKIAEAAREEAEAAKERARVARKEAAQARAEANKTREDVKKEFRVELEPPFMRKVEIALAAQAEAQELQRQFQTRSD